MLIKHDGYKPKIHRTAYVAPNAAICGNVSIGKHTRIMFGAQIIAENAPVVIGDHCIVLENAVIRGTQDLPVQVGNHCLVGPHAHLAGCTLEDNVFIATGASVFHGATVKAGAEIRVNGVVHLRTLIPEGKTVPIGWVAVGNPAQMFPPDKHEEIWNIQKELDFPRLVYGIGDREKLSSVNKKLCETMSDRLKAHKNDRKI